MSSLTKERKKRIKELKESMKDRWNRAPRPYDDFIKELNEKYKKEK